MGRTPNYVIVILLFAVSAGATHWIRSRPVRFEGGSDLKQVPMKAAKWSGRDLEIEPDVVKLLNADQVLSRSYLNTDDEGYMDMLVVYRKYNRRDFFHRPEICYPASGWTIVEKSITKMPFAGRMIDAVKVVAEKDGDREVVIYWFASGARTEADYVKQQLWMTLDRLRPKKLGWAFIRINAPVVHSEADTLREITNFVKITGPPLLDAISAARK